MEYEAAKRGYANLWNKARITPSRAATARGIAKNLLANKARYEKVAVQVGDVPWWWIAAIHQMEASANFRKYLGNGQAFDQKTTLEPKGRGPFVSFEAGAVDAIRLKGLHKIPEWDITRALFEAERYNGWGYVGRINSPYLWSFTTLQQRGKFVADHVWDPNFLSTQCGVAAIFKAFEEIGAVEFDTQKEDSMAELRASLLPFGGIAPLLVKTLAGPAASLAIRAIVEAFDDDDKPEPKAEAVQKKLEEVPLRNMPDLLGAAEAALKAVLGDQPEPEVPAVDPTLTTTPVVAVPITPPAVVVSPEKEELGIVDRIFGGKRLAGLKTPFGILVYCIAWAGAALAPNYFTPDIVSAMYAFSTALVGIGVTAKIDKVLPWLATITAVVKR